MKIRTTGAVALAIAILVSGIHSERGYAYSTDAGALFARFSIAGNNHKAAEREKNPPGDIPDNQVFIPYRSAAGGYSLKVPEGWACTETGADVSFTDHLNAITVVITDSPQAPDVKSVRDGKVAILDRTGKAVSAQEALEVRISGMRVLHMVYASHSEPNAVTGKSARLENEAFLFFKGGKLATLTLSAPTGADNADQWKLISQSFRWN